MPPSTNSVAPVVYSLRGSQRNMIDWAISSGSQSAGGDPPPGPYQRLFGGKFAFAGCVDPAWLNYVDSNLLVRQFQGCRLGHGFDRRFRHVIGHGSSDRECWREAS